MSNSRIDEQAETIPLPQAPFVVRLVIVTFTLGYMTLAMYMVVDVWVLEQTTLKRIVALPPDQTLPSIFVSAVHSILGAILGAGALDVVSFHRYVAVKRDFQATHVWGYFVAPWLAAVLGLIVFALLQSGLLVFTGGTQPGNQSAVSNLGYLAVGFLSGFGWFQATERIREIISRFFAPGPNKGVKQQQTTNVIPGTSGADNQPRSTRDSAKTS